MQRQDRQYLANRPGVRQALEYREVADVLVGQLVVELGLLGLVLLLALAQPAFRETADEDWLKKSDLAVTFLDRYGNPIGSRGIKHNDSVPLEDFPDNLIKATLATEDRRFYDHFGIDIAGTARALVTNAQAGGVRQGGSSLTQQLAKNLFLSNERTYTRKINEAFLALWLEYHLTKREIAAQLKGQWIIGQVLYTLCVRLESRRAGRISSIGLLGTSWLHGVCGIKLSLRYQSLLYQTLVICRYPVGTLGRSI